MTPRVLSTSSTNALWVFAAEASAPPIESAYTRQIIPVNISTSAA